MERMDRRGDAQPRPLTLIPNFVETADGSCLITAGKTRVICTASVEEGVPPFLKGKGQGWLTAEYAMLPASTGGGRIRVDQLDGVDVSFTGIFNTLVVRHQDVAGELSRILNELSVSGVNIANMSLNRDRRGGDALTVVETDQKIPADALERIQALYGVLGATYYEKEED